jgi:hypothetical protein
MKLLPLTLTILLSTLSSLVLADQKVTYSCDNAHGTTVIKTGPVVGDKFAAKIVANMATWSSHKYLVSKMRSAAESASLLCAGRRCRRTRRG